MDLDSVWTWLLCDFSVFGDFCCESYMGAFTEVACFEETKAVAPGTGARYGRVCARTRPVQVPNLLSFATSLTW